MIENENIKIFKEKHRKDSSFDYNANGYKYLEWQNGWTEKPKEYLNCREQNHQLIDVSHNNRGTENTVSCPECLIYWK